MTKRTVFHVVYDNRRRIWVTKVHGSVIAGSRTKYSAVTTITAILPFYCEHFGILSQLIIHTKSGKIAREYTYGRDPKRSRG